MIQTIKVGSFNILAESLSNNEFLCEGGDDGSINWNIRFPKIVSIIDKMLETCDIVVTQENDHFKEIYIHLKNTNNGIFCSKDNKSIGLGIYYKNTLKFNYIKDLYNNVITNIDNSLIYFTSNSFIKCNFTFNDKSINIYPAHLKSGESELCENKRYNQLKTILDDTSDNEYPIIIMDSNNSKLYEREYNCNRLSDLIKMYSFKNAIDGEKGNECFKMRHGCGEQSNKFFNLMFDDIDKILIRDNINIEKNTIDYGFKKYNINNYEHIMDIRSNKNKRNKFKQMCIDNITGTDSKAFHNSEYEIFEELYPNINAPSDHPPISVIIKLE
jgi:hypothetical protein